MNRDNKIIKEKPLIGRNEIVRIVKKLLKDDAYVPARDIPVFYKLLKQYPDVKFWTNYDLGFKLNAMFWLVGSDGQQKLKSDYAVFLLDLKPEQPYVLEIEKVGDDFTTEQNNKKSTNLADFLR